MTIAIDIKRLETLEEQGCRLLLTGGPGRWSVTLANPNAIPIDAKVQVEKYSRRIGAALAERQRSSVLLRSLGVKACLIEDTADAARAISDLVAETNPLLPIGLDIETMPVGDHGDGRDPNRAAIRTVQLYAGGRFAAVIDMTKVPFDVLKSLAGIRLVAHNALFETRFLMAHLGPIPIDCTMLLNRHLSGPAQIGLADLAWQHLGVVVSKEHQTVDWSGALTDDMIVYAALDAVLARRLFEIMAPNLLDARPAYEATIAAQRAIAMAANRGILLDQSLYNDFMNRWASEQRVAEAELQVAVPGVDFSKPKQVRKWIDSRLNKDQLADFPRTPKGELAVTKENLSNWAVEIPELVAYARKNEAAKKRDRHAGLASRVNPVTGRIHPHFNIAGAITGRMSCKSPNTQSQEKGDGWRRCFRAAAGYVLVKGDWSQIELRIAALIANERRMLNVLRAPDGDIHKETAAAVMRTNVGAVTSEQRRLAKALNFGLLYGMGAETFMRYAAQPPVSATLTLAEAANLRQGFFAAYPGLRQWQHRQARQVRENANWIATTVLGRKVRSIYVDDSGDVQFHYTRSLNVPIQGSGADLLYVALTKLPATLEGLDACPVLFVHDEIVLEVAESDAPEAARRLEAVMTEAFVELFPNAREMVRVVDVQMDKTWGD